MPLPGKGKEIAATQTGFWTSGNPCIPINWYLYELTQNQKQERRNSMLTKRLMFDKHATQDSSE